MNLSSSGQSPAITPGLVHVIIVNWQNWQDTIDCVESLGSQDYQNYQIVIVDNGSTNDSANQLRARLPQCEVLVNRVNKGFAGGNNSALKRAMDMGAEYTWVLNNDTKPFPGALGALVRTAQQDPQIAAVGSVLMYMNEPARVQAWGGGYIDFRLGRSTHCIRKVRPEKLHYLTAASILLRSQALQQIGLLDEGFFMYWEDVDLSFRFGKAGWKIAVAPDALVLHKESASLGKRNPILEKYFSASLVRFFRKHARTPWIPIYTSFIARIAKRGIRMEWKHIAAVFQGTFHKKGPEG